MYPRRPGLLPSTVFSAKLQNFMQIPPHGYTRSNIKVVTVSDKSKLELEMVAKKGKRITVVGMGLYNHTTQSKFISSYHPTFLFVGGQIRRKNLKFLMAIWPSIFTDTGATLKVTTSKSSRTLKTEVYSEVSGVEYITDPSDAELSELYDETSALLLPSLGEGFGMPLLEVMSHGKPFIATDTGAATELLVGRSKILPLINELWRREIITLASSPTQKDDSQINKSKGYTWESVADKIMSVIRIS